MQSLPKSWENASISSRITTVILVVDDYQINDNCFNEPFAVSSYKDCTDHMHGLVFETSIYYWQDQPGECTIHYMLNRDHHRSEGSYVAHTQAFSFRVRDLAKSCRA